MQNDHNFESLAQKQDLIIVTHRGFWGGNILQNTRESSQMAVLAGSDIIEIDICRSSDNVYYLYHDGQEEELLGLNKDFGEYSSQEIDQINVKNAIAAKSGKTLEKLIDYLNWLPETMLVNIDRSYFYWDDPAFFEILINSKKINQLFIKSGVADNYLSALSKHNQGVPYVAIIKEAADLTRLNNYSNINLIGVELVTPTLDCDILTPSFMEKINHFPIRLANLEDLGEEYNLFANIVDETVIANGAEALNKIVQLGFNAVQTDWPNFIYDLREKMD